jgi:hypothetical protein
MGRLVYFRGDASCLGRQDLSSPNSWRLSLIACFNNGFRPRFQRRDAPELAGEDACVT